MQGFTLIELLVAVLIIAILTAIALPQYYKVVEKSRVAEAVTIGKAIIDAQNRSLDSFPGSSVATKRALDVSLSGGDWSDAGTYTTKNFTYTLEEQGVRMRRNNGSMQYTLFMGNNESDTERSCEGDLCRSLSGMGFEDTSAIQD